MRGTEASSPVEGGILRWPRDLCPWELTVIILCYTVNEISKGENHTAREGGDLRSGDGVVRQPPPRGGGGGVR